jgi:hypothetical protein
MAARTVRVVARTAVSDVRGISGSRRRHDQSESFCIAQATSCRRVSLRAVVLVSVAAVSLSNLFLAACGQSTVSSPALTPAAAAKAYYHFIAQHQLAAAASYVAPGARGGITSENGNYRTLTHIKIAAVRNVSATLLPYLTGISLSDYRAFAQAAVSYYATYDHVIDASNGHATAFVYLGDDRDKAIGWQILSVGSGP